MAQKRLLFSNLRGFPTPGLPARLRHAQPPAWPAGWTNFRIWEGPSLLRLGPPPAIVCADTPGTKSDWLVRTMDPFPGLSQIELWHGRYFQRNSSGTRR